MKKKFFKFLILYFCMILFFVLRYYITSELKASEMYNYSSEMIWIWYLRNAINVLYYILEFLLLFALCNTENFSSVLECIEMYNYSSEMIWIWYLRNAINVLYYILEFLLLFALCNTENFSSVLECILLIPVALISCFASIFIIEPFSWIYANSEYFIPFGTMLFCALLCRWYKKHQSKN